MAVGVAAEAVGADVIEVVSGAELVCATGSSTAGTATFVSLTLHKIDGYKLVSNKT